MCLSKLKFCRKRTLKVLKYDMVNTSKNICFSIGNCFTYLFIKGVRLISDIIVKLSF